MWWRLFWWIVTTAISDLLQKVPPDRTPAGVGDFGVPTATEGRVVPVVLGGTMRINAPNCIWYGDYAAIERTQSTGVIIKKESVIGFTYELSLQYALFKGRCVGMTRIWIGDDVVWNHIDDNAGVPGQVADVDREDLFGGSGSGGGFIGRIRLFDGAEDQPVSAFLATRVTAGLPAYRGTAYIVITDLTETKGAEIGESPNLRYIRVEVQTFDDIAGTAGVAGLGDALALGNDHHFIGADANPMSVAYDLYVTNQRWGRVRPPSEVNLANFRAAAEVCFTEGIGFTMLVDEFTTTGQIQDWIEQHVDGYIGPNAITGQFEVNLARQDYTPAAQFQVTDANIESIKTWNKGDWSQTFNRVRMRYADRDKEWNETHAVANAPANRIIQGRLASQEVRYPGVHDATVANKIVAREKKNLSRPGRSGTIEINRTAWEKRPGEVMVVTSTKARETDLAVRITKAEVGDPINNTMIFDVVQDFFDSENPTVAEPPVTDFVPPVQNVDPFLAADQWAIEAPYIINRQDPTIPNVAPRLMTGARRLTGAPTEYEIRHRLPGGSGLYVSIDFITGGFMLAGALRNVEVGWLAGNGGKSLQVDPLAGSLDLLIEPQSPGSFNMTGIAVINPGTSTEEWVICTDIVDDLGGIRLENVWRGAFDTAQHPHVAGERIWFIWTGGVGLPSFQYTAGDSPDVKLLPRSPTDAVDEGAAIEISLVPFLAGNTRYQRPLLPARMSLNGTDFSVSGSFDLVFSTGGATEFVGLRFGTRLRDWRNQDPLDQVGGGAIRSDIWGDDAHEVQWWVYNLETDPTPSRGDAIFNSTAGATFASDGAVDFLKDAVRIEFENAGKNELPMRVEVETSHIPGFGLPRMVSRDVIIHDFTGSGTFIIPFDATFVHCDFEAGAQGDRFVRDKSANLHDINCNNTDTGIDTTTTPPIGTRGFRFGDDNAFTSPVNSSGYLRMASLGAVSGELDLNQDFTIECRLRWHEVPLFADETICGQNGGGGNAAVWRFMYMEDEDYFRFNYALTGGAINQSINMVEVGGPFTPTIDTWYAIMLTRQEQPDGSITLRLFRDGIKVSEQNVAAFTINTNTPRPDFSIGAGDIYRSIVSGVTGDGLNAYMDEFRLIQGAALELIDHTVPTVSADAGSQEYLVFQSNFTAEAGIAAGNFSEDYGNLGLGWVYEGGATVCRISSAKAKFGNTSLFIDGSVNSAAGLNAGAGGELNHGHEALKAFDFTIEGWVNFDALPSTSANGMALCGSGDNGGNQRSFWFGFDNADEVRFVFYADGLGATAIPITATTTPALAIDTWYHIAVCRNGNAIEAWIDGTRVIDDATFFDNAGSPHSINDPFHEFSVGKAFSDEVGALHRAMDGHVDSIRIIKREAIYTGASITVPTEPFPFPRRLKAGRLISQQSDLYFHNHFNAEDTTLDPAWHQVEVLLELEGTDLDTTTTDDGHGGITWTFAGNAQIDNAQSAIGSTSLLLDGAGDYLFSAENGSLDINAEDFCIEAFVRFNGDPLTATMTFVAQWDISGAFRAFWFGLANNQLELRLSSNGTAQTTLNEAWNPLGDTWYHVAVSRKDGTVQFFVDGVRLAAGVANTTDVSAESSAYTIGARQHDSTPTDFMNGWIDQVRMTIGEGRYIDIFDYVVPTAARAQKQGFEFYPDHSDNGFLFTVRVGTPFLDPAQKKFGTASLYLDGSSHVEINDNAPALSSLNFQIECQVRFDGDPGIGNATFLANWDTTGSDQSWILALRNNQLVFEWNDGAVDTTLAGTWNPATATWYHLLVSKVQGVTRIFVDGTELASFEATSTTRAIDDGTEPLTIGTHMVAGVATDRFIGWIDEVRIITDDLDDFPNHYFKVANFTAPIDEYDFHRVISQPGHDRDVRFLGQLEDQAVNAPSLVQTQFFNVDEISSGIAGPFSTVTPERGGGSPSFFQANSNSAYLEVPHQSVQHMRNQDFTLEGWFRHTTDPKITQQFYASKAEIGEREAFGFYYSSVNDALQFLWSPTGLAAATVAAWADFPTIAVNTWYHLAMTREGDTIRFFVDGTLLTNNVGSATLSADEELFVNNDPFGWQTWDANFAASNPSQQFRGQSADLRWTAGKALYTASFTAPTQYHPRFGGTWE